VKTGSIHSAARACLVLAPVLLAVVLLAALSSHRASGAGDRMHSGRSLIDDSYSPMWARRSGPA
jgi:hypothetical protein